MRQDAVSGVIRGDSNRTRVVVESSESPYKTSCTLCSIESSRVTTITFGHGAGLLSDLIMMEFVTSLMIAYTTMLFVVDPLGVVPAWLVMTESDTPQRRRALAREAAIVVTVTLSIFGYTGGALLRLLGIGMPAFQIAGSIILVFVALDMIRAHRSTQEGPGEIAEGRQKEDIAVTPLGIPMLAGPAALTTVTMLVEKSDSWWERGPVFLAVLLIGLSIEVTLRLAEPLHRLLGRTGIQVFSRLLGLVLLAYAVQFGIDGIQGISWNMTPAD